MESKLNISVIDINEISSYESILNSHLRLIFDSSVTVEINNEFHCAIIVEDKNEIIACGFAYKRQMSQGSVIFSAGVIGGIAVNAKYRSQGVSKAVLNGLERELQSSGVLFSFLFAYDPKVYFSSGYLNLSIPIKYYDKHQRIWKHFIYKGSMFKPFGLTQLDTDQTIEFKGCVY